MNHLEAFDAAFDRLPLVAILRGVRPEEATEIAEALIDEAFELIEVPLNSPDPLKSIRAIADACSGRALIGAGTVLSVADVRRVADMGGSMVISPNCDSDVIGATIDAGLVSIPGFLSVSEAFAATAAGATALKLFPAEAVAPAVLRAMRAVLPTRLRILPVGGISPETMGLWRANGASGFGLGSALYQAGRGREEVGAAARSFRQQLNQQG